MGFFNDQFIANFLSIKLLQKVINR